MKTVVIPAVQGAFIEHYNVLKSLKQNPVLVRKKQDLPTSFDAIVLPGGESTTQGKLLRELDIYNTLKDAITNNVPTLGTCAGMILLAANIEGGEKTHFATSPFTVRRNAYGRQLGSFFTTSDFKGLGKVPMTFIRAPFITSFEKDVEELANVDGNTVAVRYKNQLSLAFHPELDKDVKIYKYFLSF